MSCPHFEKLTLLTWDARVYDFHCPSCCPIDQIKADLEKANVSLSRVRAERDKAIAAIAALGKNHDPKQPEPAPAPPAPAPKKEVTP